MLLPQLATSGLFGATPVDQLIGVGPAGPIHSVTGGAIEVRSLVHAKAKPDVWATLSRRLALLKLLDHPAVLKPVECDLESDPPFLTIPASRPVSSVLPSYQFGSVASSFASLIVAAHRLGLNFGSPSRTEIRVTAEGRLAFELTATGADRSESDLRIESDPADDIAWLGHQLESLFEPEAIDEKSKALIARMTAPIADDRPLADEIEAFFRPVDPQMTMVTEVGIGDGPVPAPAETRETGAGEDPGTVPPPKVGDRLGRFLLLEKIGEGGVGVVYRAEDPVDGASVAIKVLRARHSRSDVARRRFIKEARLLGAVDTPFVTRLVEANTDGAHSYLALEFVAGQTVGDLLRDAERLGESTALGLIADAARGLAAAHAVGIVHRDMKPDNLLISRHAAEQRVKVSDFGLARPVVQTESLEVTSAGAVLGTPLYMAPEQFGNATVGPQADVYSLGATLFHMLAGRPPFPADNLPALARAVATEAPPALDKIAPNTSAAVAAFVARCLSKAPEDRPPDAEAFLREIERLRSGAPSDLSDHPRLPAGSGNAIEYVHVWELAASPAQLWPYVSNTERLNRAAGLPSVNYELRRDPRIGTRRFASARVGGMKMEWEEHPFEWIEGRRMGVLREFARGPFIWFISRVELEPLANGGTRLRQVLRAEPRHAFGRLAARLELGIKSARNLGKVYRRIDGILATQNRTETGDPFEVPTRLTGPRQRLLQNRMAALAARDVPAEVTDVLGLFLSNAPEPEVARIRPIALARKFNLDETAVVDACFKAVPTGLLELKWDLICPLCRIPAGRRDTLRELHEHENCAACDRTFAADFAGSVEAVFRVHPDIRRAEPGTYCAGGPAHSPHVVAQTRVASGEHVELELALSPGRYGLRGPQLAHNVELRVESGAAVRHWEIDLAKPDSHLPPRLASGGLVLALGNSSPYPIIARIERTVPRDDLLTASRAVTLPVFRELFPGEVLSSGQLVPASVLTFLLVDIDGGEALFETRGEGPAFRLIQSAFQSLMERIREEGGTVLKSVGTGLVATFSEAAAALRAAVMMPDALAANPDTSESSLRIALHRGLALVATLNDRLDYFGQTPMIAGRLLQAAQRDEMIISQAVAEDPACDDLLRDRAVRIVELSLGSRGRMLARRVALTATNRPTRS